MARYVLQRKHDGSIVEGISWNKKSHAEAWIQHTIKMHRGLDWRVGGLFRCKGDIELEVVWAKSLRSVNWFDIEPAPLSEYDPTTQ